MLLWSETERGREMERDWDRKSINYINFIHAQTYIPICHLWFKIEGRRKGRLDAFENVYGCVCVRSLCLSSFCVFSQQYANRQSASCWQKCRGELRESERTSNHLHFHKGKYQISSMQLPLPKMCISICNKRQYFSIFFFALGF